MHKPDAHKRADEPENGAQKAKGNSGLPLFTSSLFGDISPSPDRAALYWSDEVDEQTEGNDPENEQDKVDGVMDEAGFEGDEPDECKHHGYASNDFSIDEALLGP